MEHISEELAGDFYVGTASDHYRLAWSHLARGTRLLFCCPPGAGGAAVSPRGAALDSAAKAGGGASSSVSHDDDDAIAGASVIFPTAPWKEAWDLWVLMLILYSAVMVPYRICFNSPAEGSIFYFEQVITFSFITDVILNFNTAYFDEAAGGWVTNRGDIALHYLRGWFWIDMPSSLPIELIDLMLEGDNSTLGYLRFLRLFRLLRLLRLLKIGEYIANLEMKFDLNLTFLRICQMIFSLCFLAHMLGCFWFYIAALEGLDGTWVGSYDDGTAVDAPPDVQYLYSVYWALTTLTTVGYGDITPTNNVERIYSLFALLIGALVFGFMLSSIGSLVEAMDRQAALSQERLDEVKEYMRWRKLPRDLVIRMRRYYTYYYSRKTAFDEEAILNGLTPSLRSEVVSHNLRESLGKIELFAPLSPTFQGDVFSVLKPLNASINETIFAKGDRSLALYLLVKGTVEVISGVDGRVLYRVRSGQFFGESVLTGMKRPSTHRAVTPCEMYEISADDLDALFERHEREGKLVQEAVLNENRRKERLRNLSLRMTANKMKDQDTQAAAALRIQVAWTKTLDRMVYDSFDFAHEEANLSVKEKLIKQSKSGGGGGGGGNGGGDGGSPSSKSPASKKNVPPIDVSLLASRIDKIDDVMTRLEQLVGGSSSQRGNKSKLSNRAGKNAASGMFSS